MPVKLADNWAVDAGEPDDHGRHQGEQFRRHCPLKAPDGTLNALEVLIFPGGRRAAHGEGHCPSDVKPESMMTNATVATVAAAPDGQTLTLKHKDGTQTIKVKPGTPIS